MSLLFRRRALVRLAAGELSAGDEQDLRRHLTGCAACRRHYDALALIADAAGPGRRAAGHARDRLAAALASAAPARPAPAMDRRRPRLGARFALVLAPALGAIVFLALRLRPPAPRPEADDEIAWRGPPPPERDAAAPSAAPVLLEGEALRAGLVVRVYASRRSRDGRPGPLRMVGELPGSGELKVGADEYVQLAYAGLKERRALAVFAAGGSGELHPFWPRPAAPSAALLPSPEPRPLGRSLELGAVGLTGRGRLLAIVSEQPISAAFGAAAARSALAEDRPGQPVVVLGGVLIVEP